MNTLKRVIQLYNLLGKLSDKEKIRNQAEQQQIKMLEVVNGM